MKAVIYDMDGTLIDSEPLWQQAEIELFATVGIQLNSALCTQTMGLRIDQVVSYWFERQPWSNIAQADLADKIVARVIELIKLKGEPLPGIQQSLEFFHQKGLNLALASSSGYPLIEAVLTGLGLNNAFVIAYSATEEVYGKPHPAVYLTTAEKLGVKPSDCLAIEDSLNGVLAAKASLMRCLAIPAPSNQKNPKFVIADQILASLAEIDQSVWHNLTGALS
ncbi:MAG: hexitol phosphatase HxpB [Cyanobacteria bacterium P01_H01_bin.15]